MRLAGLVVLTLVAPWVEAQTRANWRMDFPPPPPRQLGGGHPGGPGRAPGGWGWSGWGWGGWAGPETVRVIVRTEAEKEKDAPAHVSNKDYVAERLSPRMTEVAGAAAVVVAAEWADCGVVLVSGERFEGARCAEVDDTLLVRAQSGRRYRFSLDLVETVRR